MNSSLTIYEKGSRNLTKRVYKKPVKYNFRKELRNLGFSEGYVEKMLKKPKGYILAFIKTYRGLVLMGDDAPINLIRKLSYTGDINKFSLKRYGLKCPDKQKDAFMSAVGVYVHGIG